MDFDQSADSLEGLAAGMERVALAFGLVGPTWEMLLRECADAGTLPDDARAAARLVTLEAQAALRDVADRLGTMAALLDLLFAAPVGGVQ